MARAAASPDEKRGSKGRGLGLLLKKSGDGGPAVEVKLRKSNEVPSIGCLNRGRSFARLLEDSCVCLFSVGADRGARLRFEPLNSPTAAGVCRSEGGCSASGVVNALRSPPSLTDVAGLPALVASL